MFQIVSSIPIALVVFLPAFADGVSPALQDVGALETTTAQDPADLVRKLASEEARATFLLEMRKAGVQIDPERRELRIEGEMNRSRMPLEFLIVTERGASHEALIRTRVRPTFLTAGLFFLGMERGQNVAFVPRDPPPSEEELRSGVSPFETVPPSGPGVVIYLAWEENGWIRRYRAEDLVVTERDGRTMPWTRWIFIGSRFIRPERDEPEVFAADIEGDVVSICYFSLGNQVLTNPHPWAKDPIFWPNHSLLPEYGTKVIVTFALEPHEARAGAEERDR